MKLLAPHKIASRWVVHLAYLAASTLFAFPYYFLSETATHPWGATPFDWQRPFQFRILIPAAEYLLRVLLPFPWSIYHVAFTVLFVYLLLLTFERLLAYFGFRRAWLLACSILYPLTWNYIILDHLFFASDIPAIVFFTVTLYEALERRWSVFYPLFFLALFNRESIILVVPAYLLLLVARRDQRGSLRALVPHVLAQLGLFALVKGLLSYLFRNNPGSDVQNMIGANTTVLLYLLHGTRITWEYVIACFGGLHILSLLLFRRIPRELRFLFVLFPLVLSVMFVAGFLLEVRIYGELVPVVTLLVLAGLGGLFPQWKLTDSSLAPSIKPVRSV